MGAHQERNLTRRSRSLSLQVWSGRVARVTASGSSLTCFRRTLIYTGSAQRLHSQPWRENRPRSPLLSVTQFPKALPPSPAATRVSKSPAGLRDINIPGSHGQTPASNKIHPKEAPLCVFSTKHVTCWACHSDDDQISHE